MLILSHPTGNAFVREALAGLHARTQDYRFYTTFAWPQSWKLPMVGKSLLRRSYPIPYSHISSHPWRELGRLSFFGKSKLCSIDAVYTSLDKTLAADLPKLHRKNPISTVYAYEDGAYHSFLAAKALGIRCVYDLPIGHQAAAQETFRLEAELSPAWVSTLTGLTDPPEKLRRKDEELALADTIVAASSFTASTLQGRLKPHQKLAIIPYGAPTACTELPKRPTSGKLKVLYVGSLTQRKGIRYLFEAISTLKDHVSLTVIGRRVAECAALDSSLKEHTYFPSLPHAEILEQMRAHDILVFPSLFEGFGLVLTEALSCGLPFIATSATAAPDLITDGREGFIVPLRSSQAIAEKLSWALQNREALAQMQFQAHQKAQNLGWADYRKSLINTLYAS